MRELSAQFSAGLYSGQSRLPSVLLALLLGFSGAVSAQSNYDHRPTIGPEHGWLVIDGGGQLTNEVKERFLALAGGREARIVAIPAALDDRDINVSQYGALIAQVLGVAHVTVLHTRDRALANSATFAEPLQHATGVWIEGGRQWRLADAYLGTAIEREPSHCFNKSVTGWGSCLS